MSLHAQHIRRTELVDMALGGTHSVGGRVSCLRLGTLDVDPVVGLLNFDISTISEGFTDNLFLSTFKCPFNKFLWLLRTVFGKGTPILIFNFQE